MHVPVSVWAVGGLVRGSFLLFFILLISCDFAWAWGVRLGDGKGGEGGEGLGESVG